MKNWEKRALELLNKSLTGLPHELNELDWKETISPNHEKLSQHLSAFANNPGGGFMVFGIDNKTKQPINISALDGERIITTLTNRARDTVNPAVMLEHSHIKFQNHDLLLLFIHESTTKPVHIKKGTIEDAFIRSGGSTRRASRSEVGGLMLNSHLPRWEELNATLLLTESEVLGLLDFYAIHQLLNRPAPSTNQEVLH